MKRKTAKDRFRRSLKSIAEWCREHRHLPVTEQQAALTAKLRGHFAYYGITGNSRSLEQLPVPRDGVPGTSGSVAARARHDIPWERFGELERRYPLPPARLRRVRLVT